MVRSVVDWTVVQGTSVVTVVVDSSGSQVVWVTVTVTSTKLVFGLEKRRGWQEPGFTQFRSLNSTTKQGPRQNVDCENRSVTAYF